LPYHANPSAFFNVMSLFKVPFVVVVKLLPDVSLSCAGTRHQLLFMMIEPSIIRPNVEFDHLIVLSRFKVELSKKMLT